MAGLAIALITTVATLGQRGFALIASGRAAIREAEAKAMLEAAAKARAAEKARAAAQIAPAVIKAPETPQRGRKGKLTADEALKTLQILASQTDGRIVGSNATLAASLNVPVSTLCDRKNGWLVQWVEQGKVQIVAKKRGQTVVSVSTAKAA